MKRAWIIGATSAIAQETQKLLAQKGMELYLVARDGNKLNMVAEDLKVRGAEKVVTEVLDMAQPFDPNLALQCVLDALGGVDLVFIAHGSLSDQVDCQNNYRYAENEIRVNFLSVAALLTPVANYFENEKRGTIAVISSVAGDRGRQSNYIYGTAKAAKTAFLQGLRNRLYPSGVKVITIKPGFVDTPMTAHLKKGLLFASPQSVALGIVKAIEKGKNEVYLPWFWQPIMFIIKHIPESIFKRLKL